MEAGQFSVIALVESWLVALPCRVAAVAAAANYTPLVLPALPSTNGHGCNQVVFVHCNLRVSGVTLQRTEWVEYVSFLLEDCCHLVVLYQACSSSLQSYGALLPLFADTKYDLPSLWMKLTYKASGT